MRRGRVRRLATVSQRTLQRLVEVALVDSFSGAGAAVGRRAENSLRVQVDGLNAPGGLLGRRVEVISADDESNPDKARELVHELLNDSRRRPGRPDTVTSCTASAKLRLRHGRR